jgi:DNA-binding NtrC family response regulator
MNESSPQRRAKSAKKLANGTVSVCHAKQFNPPGEGPSAGTLAAAVAGATDAAIDVALRASGGNRALAARSLGITARTLYRFLAIRKNREGSAL